VVKEAYYFSHDANARNDIKIKAMMSRYGYEGYGMYWAIVEMLRETKDYELPMEDYTFLALQREFNGCSTDVQQYISDCIETFKLFETNGQTFWSNSLKKRMEIRDAKREQARQAGIKSAEKRRNTKEKKRPFNDRSTTDEQLKERKEKEKDIYIVDSEYLWGLYPEKKGKETAMKKLPKLIKEYGKEQMERTIQRYIEEVDKKRKNGFPELNYKNGSTFFNSGYVDYLDENYQEIEPPPARVLQPIIVKARGVNDD
jgi:hypothetical protein